MECSIECQPLIRDSVGRDEGMKTTWGMKDATHDPFPPLYFSYSQSLSLSDRSLTRDVKQKQPVVISNESWETKGDQSDVWREISVAPPRQRVENEFNFMQAMCNSVQVKGTCSSTVKLPFFFFTLAPINPNL